MEEIKNKKETLSWLVFLGCMFVGMGIGMIFDHEGVGMFIGMGVGYIAEAIIESTVKSNAQSNTTCQQ